MGKSFDPIKTIPWTVLIICDFKEARKGFFDRAENGFQGTRKQTTRERIKRQRARVRIRGNETLFSAKFKARDALKDDRALRKFTFTAPLQINEQVVTHGECVSADEAFDEAMLLERRIKTPCRRLMES